MKLAAHSQAGSIAIHHAEPLLALQLYWLNYILRGSMVCIGAAWLIATLLRPWLFLMGASEGRGDSRPWRDPRIRLALLASSLYLAQHFVFLDAPFVIARPGELALDILGKAVWAGLLAESLWRTVQAWSNEDAKLAWSRLGLAEKTGLVGVLWGILILFLEVVFLEEIIRNHGRLDAVFLDLLSLCAALFASLFLASKGYIHVSIKPNLGTALVLLLPLYLALVYFPGLPWLPRNPLGMPLGEARFLAEALPAYCSLALMLWNVGPRLWPGRRSGGPSDGG